MGMTTTFENNENSNNNNNISEQEKQKVILANNDNQIDTTNTTTSTISSNNEDNTFNKQLSEVNKRLTDDVNNKQHSTTAVHFDVSSSSPLSPISSNNDENSPQTTNITNNLRKTMSTHLWSPTMSQNRPAIRATNKMRRQSSVVEFY